MHESPVATGLSPRAADEARTRDPQLGKLMLYQLSYRRLTRQAYPPITLADVKRSAVPIAVAVLAAALVGLLVYGVVARRDDTSLDSAVKKGQRPAAPGSAVTLPEL